MEEVAEPVEKESASIIKDSSHGKELRSEKTPIISKEIASVRMAKSSERGEIEIKRKKKSAEIQETVFERESTSPHKEQQLVLEKAVLDKKETDSNRKETSLDKGKKVIKGGRNGKEETVLKQVQTPSPKDKIESGKMHMTSNELEIENPKSSNSSSLLLECKLDPVIPCSTSAKTTLMPKKNLKTIRKPSRKKVIVIDTTAYKKKLALKKQPTVTPEIIIKDEEYEIVDVQTSTPSTEEKVADKAEEIESADQLKVDLDKRQVELPKLFKIQEIPKKRKSHDDNPTVVPMSKITTAQDIKPGGSRDAPSTSSISKMEQEEFDEDYMDKDSSSESEDDNNDINIKFVFDDEKEKFKCLGCKKFYKTRGSIVGHLRYICGKKPKHKCPFCPYMARSAVSVRVHVGRNHHTWPRLNKDNQWVY